MLRPLVLVLSLLPLTAGATRAPRADHDHEALFGVVALPFEAGGLLLAEVVPDSPAEHAGLAAGDRLLKLGGMPLAQPQELDRLLASRKPGAVVAFEAERDVPAPDGAAPKRRRVEGEATLVDHDFRWSHEYFRGRKRGELGFAAPEIPAYAWMNVGQDEDPPTIAGLRGKVIVIHAFQSL
jgi:membrane-associated protease RseP (regulator of RpoE activity)